MWLTPLIALGILACDGDKSDDTSGTTDSTGFGTTTDSGTTDNGTDSGTTDTGPVDPCTLDEVTVRVGTGESGFVPVEENGELPLFFGEQGGWHIFGGFEIFQANQIVTFELAGYDVATGVKVCHQGESALQVATVPDDECRNTYYNVFCYVLCPMDEAIVDGACDNPNETLVSRDVRFELNVTDLDGKTASDTLIFKAASDGTNPTECVEDEICTTHGSSDTGLE